MVLPGGKEISTKLALGVGGGVIAAAGIATAVILSINGQDSFRSITVLDTVGQVTVTRDSDEMEPYKDMKLESGDDIVVGEASELDMVLDADKTVYVEENTHMWLEATGTVDDSKTVIYMDAGATMHKIDNKLSEASAYNVETPNSTMSIRGTLPRVEVTERDGQIYTDYQVFEGEITIQLKTTDGKLMGEPIEVGAGYQIETRGDESISEVVLQEIDGKTVEVKPIDYKEIPSAALEHLEEIAVSGDKVLSVGEGTLQIEELHEIIEEVKAEEAKIKEEKLAEEAKVEEELKMAEEAGITPAAEPEAKDGEEDKALTPAVTPVAKILAEPALKTKEAVITPAVTPATSTLTPAVTPEASEESSSGDSGSSDSGSGSSSEPPAETYAVHYIYNSETFALKDVQGTNVGSAPTFRPEESGYWGNPVISESEHIIRIYWNPQ